jgi:CelD/BcsL family acetyltransferase involved in cellulose biosynthesis
MRHLEVSEVLTAPELEALAPAWTALWRRSLTATPFQSPAWLIPWWRHFGNGRLLTLTVRTGGGALAGVLPLYVFEEPPARKLLPVGIGISDYLDGLFDPACAGAAAAAALARLPRTSRPWDACELHQLPPCSPLLSAPAPTGWCDEVVPGEPCPVLTLPRDHERLPDGLPRGAAENLRHCRRRAERSGRVAFETARLETLPALLDAFFRLHGARWAARDLPGGVLGDDAVARFHREAAPALLGLGLLRLHVLLLDDEPAAAYYGFAANGRACYYLSGFDPDRARLSPGTLVVAHAMEQAIREGAAEFDFLRGREPHKYRWGAVDRPTYARRLWPGRGDASRPETFGRR